MRSILSTLKTEHDQLRALFEQVNATTDRAEKTRVELLEKIEAALVPHAKWEELVFYPALKARGNHEQKLLWAAAMQEHRAVEQSVLPDLKACEPTSREFAGSAKVMGELLDHHAREEEREIFAAMRELFTAQELAEMDEQYEEWKASGMAAGITLHARIKTGVASMFRSPGSPG
ncbi:hemerythrin domain-containing protein [Cognatilysobacter lacus]|uniref:Hemerythrin domain-containing protein n=1 Tax=Cognatilysobacter lacus TaxID=1643323 RepID=A0A5D8Z6F2_9GAMM|nr:hemerythrin domain-containing protein [Lysobacter lacus]TZF90086.1 hemerythrin domain-containing protein [Lysobacter lacus]